VFPRQELRIRPICTTPLLGCTDFDMASGSISTLVVVHRTLIRRGGSFKDLALGLSYYFVSLENLTYASHWLVCGVYRSHPRGDGQQTVVEDLV
jgi:hypothetical protein